MRGCNVIRGYMLRGVDVWPVSPQASPSWKLGDVGPGLGARSPHYRPTVRDMLQSPDPPEHPGFLIYGK